jgi:hypothetical protein
MHVCYTYQDVFRSPSRKSHKVSIQVTVHIQLGEENIADYMRARSLSVPVLGRSLSSAPGRSVIYIRFIARAVS